MKESEGGPGMLSKGEPTIRRNAVQRTHPASRTEIIMMFTTMIGGDQGIRFQNEGNLGSAAMPCYLLYTGIGKVGK